MEDTAQPMAAETPLHEQVDSAAAAIKAMRAVSQPRDETGRFAGETQPEEPHEQDVHEADYEGEPEANDEPEEYEAEDPDEDQSEAVEMPKSWSKEDGELWHSLPPEVQGRIAEREGQRDTAINSKFQEAANARKEYETRLAEANESRDKWARDYDNLVADLSLPEPDPREYGLGTQRYDRDAYDLAVLQWKQGSQQLQQLRQQREEIRAQQEAEMTDSWQSQKAEIDTQYMPVMLSLKPELQDPAKAEPAMRELVNYAINSGLPADLFNEENQQFITQAQLVLLEKARLYDAAKATKAPPKKQPALRPGVTTPRQAQKTVAKKKALEQLSSTGSIDDAVAAMRAARR